MHKYYFTFGSSKNFPYQNGYMVVMAEYLHEALNAFRNKYPGTDQTTINCSDYYDESEWENITKTYYSNQEPKEILYANPAYKREFELFKVLLNQFGLSYELKQGKIHLYDSNDNSYLDQYGNEREFENTLDALNDSLFDDLLEEQDSPYIDFSEYGREDVE